VGYISLLGHKNFVSVKKIKNLEQKERKTREFGKKEK
jgi:hypothetical protein